MAARVDTRAMLVRDGALAFAFAADCGAGTAMLDPEGEPHAVRLLSWREKCALARFVDAGPEFLEAQFVTISGSGSGGALPGDPGRREALSALAFWLHGGAPLPLDTELLGEVTLALCAALAIGPAELGALAAPDVEALWHARDAERDAEPVADGRAPDAMSFPSGMTRIVVEPDPAEAKAMPDAPVSAMAEAAMQAPELPADGGRPASLDRRPRARLAADMAAQDAVRAESAVGTHDAAPEIAAPDADRMPSLSEGASATGGHDPAMGQANAIPAAVSGERPASAAEQTRGARRAAPRFRFRFRAEGAAASSRGASVSLSGAATSPPDAAEEGRAAARYRPDVAEIGRHAIDAQHPAHRSAGVPTIEPAATLPTPLTPGVAEGRGERADQPIHRRPNAVARPSASRRASGAPAAQRTAGNRSDPRSEPTEPAASAIAAMVSRVSGSEAAGRTARAPASLQSAALRPAPPLVPVAPAGTSPTDARIGALVDIVTRAAAPRPDAAADPDAMIDSFGDRLADAVAELGLAGAE